MGSAQRRREEVEDVLLDQLYLACGTANIDCINQDFTIHLFYDEDTLLSVINILPDFSV